MVKTKILIVEDEAIVAMDIAKRLQTMGYDIVDMVVSGEDALVKLAELHQSDPAQLPDLILMDIILQGELDGIETTQQICQTYHIPVVYLTANADETTLQRAKLTEPFGYIVKPIKDRELRVTIEIALSRHRAERAVQQALNSSETMRQEAETVSDLRLQMLSIASHEFRTPLSSIQFSAQLLRNYGHQLTEDKRQKNLQRIQDAVGNMNQMLEDILTLNQVNAHRIGIQRESLELVEFCSDLVEMMQFSAGDRYHITLNSALSELWATLDRKLLWHLLTNLLSNAVKYSPDGGKVTLQLCLSEETIRFQIQDQGIGIPEADQIRLFEPFFRGSNVDVIPGTGLGLAIAKLVTDLHNGMITVESKLGQGTTFTVIIPV